MKNPKMIPKPLLDQIADAKKKAVFDRIRRLEHEEIILQLLLDLATLNPLHEDLMKTQNHHSEYFGLAEVALGNVIDELEELQKTFDVDQSGEGEF